MLYLARELRETMGRDLIGRTVITAKFGNWTGGECRVRALELDANAPEIVFNVERISDHARIGVFDYEFVDLLPGDVATSEARTG